MSWKLISAAHRHECIAGAGSGRGGGGLRAGCAGSARRIGRRAARSRSYTAKGNRRSFGCGRSLDIVLSNRQIAQELGLNDSDVQETTTHLRQRLAARTPAVALSGEVEIDEVYVLAGHEGNPAAVQKTRAGRRNRLKRMFPRRNRQRQRIPKRIQHVRLTCLIFFSGHTPSSSMSTWGKYGKSKYPRQEFPC